MDKEDNELAHFDFKLGQPVTITCSGEKGKVIGRAQFNYSENSYQIRYCGGDGKAVESWWTESALFSAHSENFP